jgi:PTS system nitrogen regulatory IIA component
VNTLARYMRPEDIRLDVEAPSKPALMDAVARHMEQAHSLPHDSILSGLVRREQLASTGLGQGFAIPHCRVEGLDRILAAYLRLKSPIPFDAPDGDPVTDILVLLVPKQAAEEHLAVLADATRMFSSPRFREQLRRCREPRVAKQLFEGWPTAA